MISKRTAKLIEKLPRPLVHWIAGNLLDSYIKKYANITVVNREVLDTLKGPAIFISNHLSNSDGLVLNKILGSGKVNFVAGIKLASNDLTKLGLDVVKIIPINPNSADRAAITKALNALKSGESVCIFPEGTRSRTGSMIKGKRGVLLIAKMSKLPIVPIALEGTEKLMPINDDDMGKERFYPANVKVTFGSPFNLPSQLEGEEKCAYEMRTLDFVMNSIASLLSAGYRGVYGGTEENGYSGDMQDNTGNA